MAQSLWQALDYRSLPQLLRRPERSYGFSFALADRFLFVGRYFLLLNGFAAIVGVPLFPRSMFGVLETSLQDTGRDGPLQILGRIAVREPTSHTHIATTDWLPAHCASSEVWQYNPICGNMGNWCDISLDLTRSTANHMLNTRIQVLPPILYNIKRSTRHAF